MSSLNYFFSCKTKTLLLMLCLFPISKDALLSPGDTFPLTACSHSLAVFHLKLFKALVSILALRSVAPKKMKEKTEKRDFKTHLPPQRDS